MVFRCAQSSTDCRPFKLSDRASGRDRSDRRSVTDVGIFRGFLHESDLNARLLQQRHGRRRDAARSRREFRRQLPPAQGIKKIWDPDNLFQLNANIEPQA